MTYVKVMYSSRGDGSWYNSQIMGNITSIRIDRDFGESIPTCAISLKSNTNLKAGNEVRLYVSETNNPPLTSDLFFRGTIEKIDVEFKSMNITVEDWLARTKHIVTQRNFTGTNNITDILYTLVHDDCSLNCNTSSLTSIPITTLTDYDCRNSVVFEKLINICEMIDSWFYYVPSTNSINFYCKGNASSITLRTSPDVSANVMNVPKWSSDATSVVNNSIAQGGNYTTDTVQYGEYVGTEKGKINVTIDNDYLQYYLVYQFDGHAGDITQWGVTLNWLEPDENGTYVPVYGKANINDPLKWTYPSYDNTTLSFYFDNQFVIDAPNGTDHPFKVYGIGYWEGFWFNFHEAVGDISETATDTSSYQQYGRRDQLIDANNIKSVDDIANYASQILNYWKDGNITVELTIDDKRLGIDSRSLIGKGVNIIDHINNKTLTFPNNWEGVITNTAFTYPGRGTEVTISNHSIKNPSIISMIYSLINNIKNSISDAGINDNVKTDGTTPVTNNLAMTGNSVLNFTVENTTKLV